MNQSSPEVNKLITDFAFEGQPIRIHLVDGEPWWILTDACKALDLSTPSRVAERLEGSEIKAMTLTHTLIEQGFSDATPGTQLLIVSEPGLYRVVIRSDKPEARRFQHWLFHEVLPELRRTGSYSLNPEFKVPQTFSDALRLAADQHDEIERQARAIVSGEKRIAEQQHQIVHMKAGELALKQIADADGTYCVTDAAKVMGMSVKALYAWMLANGWVYKRPGNPDYLPYHARVTSDHLQLKVHLIKTNSGDSVTRNNVRVTNKGLILLAKIHKIDLDEIEIEPPVDLFATKK